MQIPMIIYSLRPVSMLSDFAQQKTNPKSEMTDCLSVHLPFSWSVCLWL